MNERFAVKSRVRKLVLAGVFLLLLGFMIGPQPRLKLPLENSDTESVVTLEEIQKEVLEPDRELGELLRDHRCASRLRWKGMPGEKTKVVVVFVHGFSACPGELFPVLDILSDGLGANLLAIRLTGHGRKDDALSEATAEQWLADVFKARQVARAMGDEIVLVGMSTGATLSILSALEDPSHLAGLALLSPNFGVVNGQVSLLTWPWGVKLATMVTGNSYHSWEPENQERAKLWTTRYSLDVVAQMQELVEVTTSRSFANLDPPTIFVHATEDKVVRIDRMKEAFERWGSKTKSFVELPGSTRHELAGTTIAPELSTPLAEMLSNFFIDAWRREEVSE